jgi:hypothetical protein
LFQKRAADRGLVDRPRNDDANRTANGRRMQD